MDVEVLISALNDLNIKEIAGVPDSQLKVFCDYLANDDHKFHHYTPANEGNAVSLIAGTYLANGQPGCVYMQNSGLGNAVNPITSLITSEVYSIPMLFIIGHRGQPDVKDEPQHLFQGAITHEMLDLLRIKYAVLTNKTTEDDFKSIIDEIKSAFASGQQYALVVEKNALTCDYKHEYKNSFQLNRENAIGEILHHLNKDDIIVSTTGKISREVYEHSELLGMEKGQAFLNVGSMGHASMIALGLAKQYPNKRVVCIDGDGAALMHLGSLPFIAEQKVPNFFHIILNNQAHESVGGMATGAVKANYASIANACGYPCTIQVENKDDLIKALQQINQKHGLTLLEVMVSLESRNDLSRPKETPVENKKQFMKYHGEKK